MRFTINKLEINYVNANVTKVNEVTFLMFMLCYFSFFSKSNLFHWRHASKMRD